MREPSARAGQKGILATPWYSDLVRGPLLIVLLTVLLAGVSLGQPISDPANTNLILSVQATPQLAPGQEGEILLDLLNPYPWAMENLTLEAEAYAFVHREEAANVSALLNPPTLGSTDSASTIRQLGVIPPSEPETLRIVVRTSPQTASGTLFTQGTYLLRFRLDFEYEGGLRAVMVSPGFYTPAEWAYATRDVPPKERAAYRYVGFANYSFLGEVMGLGSIDGILPDSAFFVKEPLPLWPFQLLPVGAGASFAVGLFYFWRERQAAGKSIKRPRT